MVPRCAAPRLRLRHQARLPCRVTDTRALVGWGGGNVVIACRGTKSVQNMMTDVKLWRSPYQSPHRRGVVAMMVHTGFYTAWRGKSFNERVLALVAAAVKDTALEGGDGKRASTRFILTGGWRVAWCAPNGAVGPTLVPPAPAGHSLGGALACLAALEVHQQYPDAPVSVYTLGTPRGEDVLRAQENASWWVRAPPPTPRCAVLLHSWESGVRP